MFEARASPLSGMVPMYLLMSAFHSAPWLKLISAPNIPLEGPLRAPVDSNYSTRKEIT